MKQIFVALAVLALPGSVLAVSANPDAEYQALADKFVNSNAATIASYESTCKQWGERSGLANEDLSNFVSECMTDMAEIRPTGFDDSE